MSTWTCTWLPPWTTALRPQLPQGLLSLREASRRSRRRLEAVFEGGVIVDLDVHARASESARRRVDAACWSHRYWVSVLKARKLLVREQFMVAQLGLGYQRGLVLGAMAQRAGIDAGDPQALNITPFATAGKLVQRPRIGSGRVRVVTGTSSWWLSIDSCGDGCVGRVSPLGAAYRLRANATI